MERFGLIERMNMFAADTKNDKLSVLVSRVAARLTYVDLLRDKPLTESELRIISMFEKNDKSNKI